MKEYMTYLGDSVDEFMAKIVNGLKAEIQKGDVYPLMATYSEDTCDHEYIKGCDYVCVNIMAENGEIFVVDIYPNDGNSVIFSLFRRKEASNGDQWRRSLYKMTPGPTGKDKNLSLKLLKDSLQGFQPRTNGFKRLEKVIRSEKSGEVIETIVNELRRIIASIIGEDGTNSKSNTCTE